MNSISKLIFPRSTNLKSISRNMSSSTSNLVPWTRLIRFQQPGSSKILYGEPVAEDYSDLGQLAQGGGLKAKIIQPGQDGDGIWSTDTEVTDEVVNVGTLLGPLGVKDVSIIKCIGLNYKLHIAETGKDTPPHPSLFIKPSTAVGDYGGDIPIPKICQDGEADYEIELCAVIGKAAKNVSREEALDYVAGFTVGNDVSARKWQALSSRAGTSPQWCFGKGFDKWAPLGPALVSRQIIPDPSKLEMKMKLNGDLRQETPISDLLFDVPAIISFLSQGQTLLPGTVIMTGTPSGVACVGPAEKWRPLQDGDKVEMWLSEVGTLRNTIRYE